MPVIDSQLHANRYGAKWQSLDFATTVEIVIGAMDAVGVDGAVVDEFTALGAQGQMEPGVVEDDGVWRPRRPFSKLATELYPDRFKYLGRADLDDPQLVREIEKYVSDPGFAGIRLQWGPQRMVWTDPRWAEGAYGRLFELAEQYRFPIFLVIAPRADTLIPYARRYPGVQFVLDHMGAVSGVDRPSPGDSAEVRYARFDRVLDLAPYSNVAVKWCHVERIATSDYPFADAQPHLRRLVSEFGASRIMWASDATETMKPTRSEHPSTWAQALHHVADSPLLTVSEKELILGGAARAILGWPDRKSTPASAVPASTSTSA
ncbi:amidohydrolase [Mycolicibacterium farcinogenes]|uniref:amidohydrolase family protein n=1 Tax=Mycolicibacterium farcinogenes TaxID=1802 RepID=UPI001C8DAC58|nr:amidohydrolase family protein [Mycolicibacterium farcinogenes]QZH60909.1 amidohydrolase [Mycolicibacterium farcinogenes]